MKQKGKVTTFLLILLAIAAIVVSGVIYLNLEQEKGQSAILLNKIAEFESEKATLKRQVEEYKASLAKSENIINQTQRSMKEMTFSLDEQKRKAQEAASQVSSLQKDLNQARSAKAELEKKIKQGQKEIDSFKEQIAKLNKAKKQLEEKLAQGDVQLGKIVIAPEQASTKRAASKTSNKKTPSKSLEGKVLVVNKEYAFVVINLGSNNGLSNGDVFAVYQKGKTVGDIIIERVDETISSANFASPKLKNIVRENDRVMSK